MVVSDPKAGLSTGHPFRHRVFRYSEDLTDLPMRKTIPGDELQELAISLAQGKEGTADGILFLPANDHHFGGFRAFGRQAPETSEEPAAAGSASILIADHSVCDRQQPGFGRVCVRNLIEASPGHRKNLGGYVLGVGRVQATDAVPKDIGVMPFKEIVETLLGIDGDGYGCPLRHSR